MSSDHELLGEVHRILLESIRNDGCYVIGQGKKSPLNVVIFLVELM